MPRKPSKVRTKSKTIPGTNLTEIELHHLVGHSMISLIEDDPFPNDEARREAWIQNKDHIMSLVGHPKEQGGFPWGTRPDAWWSFETHEPIPDHRTQFDRLVEMGLLLPGEREEYEKARREESDRYKGLKIADTDN